MMRMAAMTCGWARSLSRVHLSKKPGQMKLAANAREAPLPLLATRISAPKDTAHLSSSIIVLLITNHQGPSGDARCWVSFQAEIIN
jgi:hypothetical protein